jgi:putative phosphoesterase
MIAVYGNIDDAALAQQLPRCATFKAGRFKAGVIHGYGRGERVLETIQKDFDASYHLVIFGHSHTPCVETIGKTVYVNPGSPTDTIFAPYNSYAIIEIDDTIEPRIIKL